MSNLDKLVFYLDESGNSGDAIPKNTMNPFLEQPSFALAGIGFVEDNNLDSVLKELKRKYKVQANDLKASHVFHKPKFIQELVQIIIEHEYPLFIELMDKKYFVAANMLQFYFIMSNATLKNPILAQTLRYLAGNIADYFDINVLVNYGQMCLNPSKDNFKKFAISLYDECMAKINEGICDSQLFSSIIEALREDLEEIESGELDENNVRGFIPPPDFNKRGEVIAMLPHVNAFCNMYARINYDIKKNLDLENIHDEQLYFEDILTDWERIMTTNEFSEILIENRHPYVNYIFGERFSFKFGRSEDYAGIQIADVIAGFCTKYFNKTQVGCLDDILPHKETINLLEDLSSQPNSQGLNIVASQTSIKKFYSL
jgi:hypothetical protein